MKLSPLRILQINSLLTGGGVDNQTLELAAGLRALGDDVTLAIPTGSRWETLAQKSNCRIETFLPRSFLKIGFIRFLARVIRENKIQIIHAHHGRDYWPAILAAKLAGNNARVVVTRHLMTQPRWLSRKFLLRFVEAICVSQAVENVLRENLRGSPGRIHQIYCGVDFSRFFPERTPQVRQYREKMNWPRDAIVFAVVGTFHLPRGKGQIEFLEAAAKLKNDFPNARFVIVGRGELETALNEKIAALGLKEIAAVHKFHDEMPLLMSAIDVLVHATMRREAFGLVTVEALASARPVIASRVDGLIECFDENEHGLFVPAGDVKALADVMSAMLKNSEMREQFGRAGRAHVRAKFSREKMAQQTRELYLKLLS